MLNKAIEIAARAHNGQLDKCGESYILHPLRVMLSRKSEVERICAVLHDVVEDTNITFNDLRKEGFSDKIIEILDCLTRRNGEDYENYITRVLNNEVACQIKLADLADNMDPNRIQCYTEKDIVRIEKYRRARERILGSIKSY
ncbi:GTP pyrophosphokinase [Tissierella sp. Yu-01]|uniref:GTP pyrophosphokinase n=1 Tax=Tissierella sp. Yu-01 TaxID=3035694 RepID=UPI00240DBF99|nr:GTP pyrophosphokinase [Tissierella sp. Yu-01]WFA09073.1 GTP pyrophosphokinase [Tissierella sp. Yu-01]